MFKAGDGPGSFKVFEDEMLTAATSSGNASAILFAHIVLARHRMEVGDYIKADRSLDDILTSLTAFGRDKLQ